MQTGPQAAQAFHGEIGRVTPGERRWRTRQTTPADPFLQIAVRHAHVHRDSGGSLEQVRILDAATERAPDEGGDEATGEPE